MDDEAEALAKRVARHLHASETTNAAWDIRFEDAGLGWARCSMVIRDDMLNGHGTGHGGIIFSLADTAFAWACNSRNVRSFGYHAAISYLSPAKSGEKLVADAREDAFEGRSGVYTVSVIGEDGRTVAIFQGLSRTAGGPLVEEKSDE
jgi:acyl-CoA thioesterase